MHKPSQRTGYLLQLKNYLPQSNSSGASRKVTEPFETFWRDSERICARSWTGGPAGGIGADWSLLASERSLQRDSDFIIFRGQMITV